MDRIRASPDLSLARLIGVEGLVVSGGGQFLLSAHSLHRNRLEKPPDMKEDVVVALFVVS